MSDGVVGWGAHRLGLASILGHDPHEIGFTCTFYCPLYMVWKDPSFLFQGQVMEQCYPQLARSTGHHHHSYWTVLLINGSCFGDRLQVLLPIFCQTISHKKSNIPKQYFNYMYTVFVSGFNYTDTLQKGWKLKCWLFELTSTYSIPIKAGDVCMYVYLLTHF